MIPLYETGDRAATVLGMPMCQNRLAVPTWSYAMEALPPTRVIEIGSYSGALAIALGLHCRAIGARMVSYDVNRTSESLDPIAKALGVEFRTASCWDAEAELAALIGEAGTTFVLCDGGNKPRELATFARYLKPGDVIGAHDYDAVHEYDPSVPGNLRPWPFSEIRAEDGNRVAREVGLLPWLQHHFDLAGWLVFQRPPSAGSP